jgi:hypothetical protein
MNRRQTIRWHFLFVFGLVMAGASQAQAGLLYSSGPPNEEDGNEMTEWIQANSFTLSSAATVSSVEFWSIVNTSAGGYNGSISWSIYANSGGAPGATVASGNTSSVSITATGNTVTGLTEFDNTFSIGSVSLAAGSYWLGLHNGPLSDQTRDEYYWEATSSNIGTAGEESIAPFTGGFATNSTWHAFNLFSATTTVPEPSSLISAGTAVLAGLGLTIRRRRRVS